MMDDTGCPELSVLSLSPQKPLLHNLPVEIIQRIAIFLPVESALDLLLVHRLLYKALDCSVVFRGIIANADGCRRKLSVWDSHSLPNNLPPSQWMQYAVADSRAAELAAFRPRRPKKAILQPWNSDMMRKFLLYGPQLIIAQHPIVNCLLATDFVEALVTSMHWNGRQMNAISFCLAARVLSHSIKVVGALKRNPDPAADTLQIFFNPSRHNLPLRLAFPMKKIKFFKQLLDDSEFLPRQHDFANRRVANFAFYLCEGPRLRSTPAQQRPILPAVPFLSFMNLPAPFAPEPLASFSTCHLEAMATADFLEDGEWVGYYSKSIGLNAVSYIGSIIREPMKVTFASKQGDRTEVEFQGKGFDKNGLFTIEGLLDPKSGSFETQTKYRDEVVVYWEGFMTPFGISGTWRGSNDLGNLWIWKRSWSLTIE